MTANGAEARTRPVRTGSEPGAADRRWIALVVIAVAQLMTALDATIVNIALPSAQRSLGFGDADRQWVITAYTLSFARAAPARRPDRRPVRAAPGVHDRLDRVRRGVRAGRRRTRPTGAHRRPGAAGRLRRRPRPHGPVPDRGHVRGPEGARQGLRRLRRGREQRRRGGPAPRRSADRVPAVAMVPVRQHRIAAGALLAGRAVLPDPPARSGARVQAPDAVLATSGLAAVVLGCSQAGLHGWGSARVLVPLAGAAMALTVFLVVQARRTDPLLPPHLLARRDRIGAYVAVAAAVVGSFGLFLMLTYHFQNVMGYTPVRLAWRSCR